MALKGGSIAILIRRDLAKVYIFTACLAVFAFDVDGQNQCFTPEETKRVIASIGSAAPESAFKKVGKELIEMRDERMKLNDKIAVDTEKNKAMVPQLNQLAEKHLLRVCQMLKESGWPSKDALKPEAFDAFTMLVTNNKSFQLQREMLPVLIEAAKKDRIGYPVVATMVDSIRLIAGLPQIFGTQAAIRGDIIYIYPLLNEEKVDEWRAEYKLMPLANQIRWLENQYMLPVLKSQRRGSDLNKAPKGKDSASDTSILGISADENEAVKVETRLVNLNVRILTQDGKVPSGINLSKSDFQVFEDGTEQGITFFSTTEAPFDLVLLLDFSGSTVEKRGLIKKAAQRFVEYARPNDRIAVVAFATEIKVIAPLTSDKAVLKENINNIKLEGSSPIWDSVKFTYDNILKKESEGRRSAVVMMTDGFDNSKQTTFADLMEIVRRGDTTIFSVYLNVGFGGGSDRMDRMAKRSQDFLWLLAEETGGQFYKAKGINDLNGIYEQVVNDLGKVFSIGYEPTNEKRDGGWRELSVKIKTHPNLVAKTRKGYYAN